MATKKKLLEAAAGSAGGGAGLDVTEVFSAYLYEGTGSENTITNNIDLSGEGGMLWLKSRTSANNHYIFDTERGFNSDDGYFIATNNSNAQSFTTNFGVKAFNSNGFTLHGSWNGVNHSNNDFVSYSFRKAPRFFDIQTYTGDGTNDRQISHNLGCVPGCVIVKRTDNNGNWPVWHRKGDFNASEHRHGFLNSTGDFNHYDRFNNATDQSTYFTDSIFTVRNNADINASGGTYVAYLFAHNDGDGEFGPNGDQDIIKCGRYTGNGSTTGPIIDLGFEPQWLLVRVADRGGNWHLFDPLRGFTADAENQPALRPNNNTVEEANASAIKINATGFQPAQTGDEVNGNGNEYVYIAIRRGPMAVPESATDVFAIDTANSSDPWFVSGFPVDMGIWRDVDSVSNNTTSARLIGTNTLNTNLTSAQASYSAYTWDHQTGWMTAGSADSTRYSWMWKRAPSYFDVVAYTGNGTAGRTVSHNLGVAPEMMWVKRRDAVSSEGWFVYHRDLTSAAYYLNLNSTAAESQYWNAWNSTAPTSSVFSLGNYSDVNSSSATYIAYLFASLDGVSKVGSYTGTGSALNIDCGFSSGARFVMIKRTDAAGQWFVFDSERGIVSGNDPFLRLNSTDAEVTVHDIIDPLSSGFSLTSNNDWETNISGGSYIFYAIA